MAQKDPDTGQLNGALGVEKIFNSYLNGTQGALKYIQDIWVILLLILKGTTT